MEGHSQEPKRCVAILRQLERHTCHGTRRAIAIARTGFWYELLRFETDKGTPYGLGKFLQPETYRKNEDNIAFSHNLWAKYAAGTHIPSPALLQLVEVKQPGSLANFHHVLFDVIDPDAPVVANAQLLFRRMHPAVQCAVFESRALKLGHYGRRRSLARSLRALEGQWHLDGLAATILLLREALAANEEEAIFEIGNAIHRALVVATSSGPGFPLRRELIMLVCLLVFPLVSSFGREFAATIDEIEHQSHVLLETILHLEDSDKIGLLPRDTLNATASILRGDYGFDLFYGLQPRLRAVGAIEALPMRSRQDLVRDEVLGGWAREVLRSHRVEKMIPKMVIRQWVDRLRAVGAEASIAGLYALRRRS